MVSISRLLNIIGLFCRISSLSWGSFAEETYNFKEPTDRSHPITVGPDYYYGSTCASVNVLVAQTLPPHTHTQTHTPSCASVKVLVAC